MSGAVPGWDIRLMEGQLAEDALGRILLSHGEVVVEVKSEPDSKTHVFIETASRGRASGIMVTEAEWWAMEVGPRAWVIRDRRDLLRMTARAQQQGGQRAGGWGRTETGVVVPKTWLVGVGL